MNECPHCGIWMVEYEANKGRWYCYNYGFRKSELFEDYCARVLVANKKGRYSVELPR